MDSAWEQEKEGKPGYAVKYPDGYLSWSPKDVFESAYLPMGTKQDEPTNSNDLIVNSDTVTLGMVEKFISKHETTTLGEKTTVVCATLVNGFEIAESFTCASAENYNRELCERICLERIHSRVWHSLGFILETARNGINQKTRGKE